MELELIKERHFAGLRVTDDRRTPLPRSQSVLAGPLEFGARLPAHFLDPRSLIGSIETLPAHVEAFRVVADVQQTLLGKPLSESGIQAPVHLTAIHDGSLATAFGCG